MDNDVFQVSREAFDLPEDVVYLDGNSLGPLPRAVGPSLEDTVHQEWRGDLIRSWNQHNWINLPVSTGEKIAPIVGAAPGQVICTDSTSVNLFKLMAAAVTFQQSLDTNLSGSRRVVLSQEDNFPTDLYMAQGLAGLMGGSNLELRHVPASELSASLDEDVALLHLTQVNFRDGSLHDMAEITRLAHDAGALVLWDLSHSAGVVPIHLDSWEVDLAVGCGYKFLNGGPGAPAWLYVRQSLQDSLTQPLTGWMGHRVPFEFLPDYEPGLGMLKFLAGTPSVLAMKSLDAALDVYEGLAIEQLRERSVTLTSRFIELTSSLPGVTCVTPLDPSQRGSQVSLRHVDAYAVMQALIEQGVIGDFRAPDLMRFGFAPLYNSLEDVNLAAETLASVLASGSYRDPRFSERRQVT